MRGTAVALLGAALVTAGCSAPRTTTPSPIAEPLTTTSSAPPTTTTTPPPPAPPCAVTSGACVSLAQKLAWLLRDGRVVRGPVPAGFGPPDQATPAGSFRVAWKDREHRSSQYGTDMPNSVFFAPGGIAFHAGPLDAPSHGCVHLTEADSAAFFDGLNVGDAVQVL
ncbi:L,D-transpeptidase [Amycolatopsis tolypomycina]|uniref:L,D-transpeptidase catalytic domain n=1 Tax=Amycolatopsis tolypomycina TaxID=208445 RepID=A0A1H4WSZ2_9PSEU|nr:L,D-transpeptidase [Amycolatopsis tolypomycina]SEC96160.1 L,D-transpeptidase catalytic domain [Amycolatopsis tolypomycina]